MSKETIVNVSWNNPDEYAEKWFASIKEAKAYCKSHGIPYKAIKVID